MPRPAEGVGEVKRVAPGHDETEGGFAVLK
jgi:hypothetical protein